MHLNIAGVRTQGMIMAISVKKQHEVGGVEHHVTVQLFSTSMANDKWVYELNDTQLTGRKRGMMIDT